MAQLGFGWGARSTPNVTFWAPNRTASSLRVVDGDKPRGFNLRSAIADPKRSRLYRPEEIWKFGDPVRAPLALDYSLHTTRPAHRALASGPHPTLPLALPAVCARYRPPEAARALQAVLRGSPFLCVTSVGSHVVLPRARLGWYVRSAPLPLPPPPRFGPLTTRLSLPCTLFVQ